MSAIEDFIARWPKTLNYNSASTPLDTRRSKSLKALSDAIEDRHTLNTREAVVEHEALVLKVKPYSPPPGTALDPDMGFFSTTPPNVELKCVLLTDPESQVRSTLPKNIPAPPGTMDDLIIETSFPSFVGRVFHDHPVEVGDIVIVHKTEATDAEGVYIKKLGVKWLPTGGGAFTSPEEVHRNLTSGPITMGSYTGGLSSYSGGKNTALIFGDSQIQGAIGRNFEKLLPKNGWTLVGGNRLGKVGAKPSFWVKDGNQSADLKQRLQAQPGLIVINLGGNGIAGTKSLLDLINETTPASKVIWLGPPPAVKPTSAPSDVQLVYATPAPPGTATSASRYKRYYVNYREYREGLANRLFDTVASHPGANPVITINATAAFDSLGMTSSPDGVHVVDPYARQYVEKLIEMHNMKVV
tara:strand:- start:47165 stop:48400 length:1236 start_codon:yes stop_codon:yes gene_type:complete